MNDIATSVTASIQKLSAEQEQLIENIACIRNEVSKINSTIIPVLKTVESSVTKKYAEAAITTKMITSQSTLRNYTKPSSLPNRTNSANIVTCIVGKHCCLRKIRFRQVKSVHKKGICRITSQS